MTKAVKEAHKVIKDWEKRKSWNSDYAGRFTTDEEDRAVRVIISLLNLIGEKNGLRRD